MTDRPSDGPTAPPPARDVPDHVQITSPDNQRVVAAAKLGRRREREARQRYLVEGPEPVREAVADGVVEEVFATPAAAAVLPSAPGVRRTLVTERVLARLADTVTPRGVVAVARRHTVELREVVGAGFLLVLVGVADPGNAGTVVRTADAAGAAGVVATSGTVDPFNPKAVRAAAGSLTHLAIVADVPVDEVVAACRRAGQTVAALDPAGESDVDDPGALRWPVAVLVGSEAHGLAPELRAAADRRVAIPVFGRAESLNLAAAVAVAAYAAARAGRA